MELNNAYERDLMNQPSRQLMPKFLILVNFKNRLYLEFGKMT